MVSPSLADGRGPGTLQVAAMGGFLLLARAVGAAANGVSEDEVRRRAALAWALAHGAVQLAIEQEQVEVNVEACRPWTTRRTAVR